MAGGAQETSIFVEDVLSTLRHLDMIKCVRDTVMHAPQDSFSTNAKPLRIT